MSERTGYSTIADALKRDNYEFDKLVLAQTNEIPADATVLVVAGPRTDLLEQEVPLLRDYLGKSGKLLVLLDPPEDFKAFPPDAASRGAARRVGIRRRIGGRGRQRPHLGGHGAGGRAALPDARDHGTLRSDHHVPAGRARLRRPPSSPRAGRRCRSCRRLSAAGRKPRWRSSRTPTRWRPRRTRATRPGPVIIGMAVAVPDKAPNLPRPRTARPRRTRLRRRKPASPRSATPTSPATPTWASRATATCS